MEWETASWEIRMHIRRLYGFGICIHSNFDGCLHVCDGQIHLASVWWSPCRESKWCLSQCTYFVVYPVEGICNLSMHMKFHKGSSFCVLFLMAYTRRYIFNIRFQHNLISILVQSRDQVAIIPYVESSYRHTCMETRRIRPWITEINQVCTNTLLPCIAGITKLKLRTHWIWRGEN
jgi:hypothetical protein